MLGSLEEEQASRGVEHREGGGTRAPVTQGALQADTDFGFAQRALGSHCRLCDRL